MENGSCYNYYNGLYRANGKEDGNYCIIIGYILGLYWDNGKENEKYYNGLYLCNGKQNGNYYSIYWVYLAILEKNMETTLGLRV